VRCPHFRVEKLVYGCHFASDTAKYPREHEPERYCYEEPSSDSDEHPSPQRHVTSEIGADGPTDLPQEGGNSYVTGQSDARAGFHPGSYFASERALGLRLVAFLDIRRLALAALLILGRPVQRRLGWSRVDS
jgi:hypothetical protein